MVALTNSGQRAFNRGAGGEIPNSGCLSHAEILRKPLPSGEAPLREVAACLRHSVDSGSPVSTTDMLVRAGAVKVDVYQSGGIENAPLLPGMKRYDPTKIDITTNTPR